MVLPIATFGDAAQHAMDDEIEFGREMFFCLFVEALIRNVTGEDEIWLIEESPLGRRLHVWTANHY